MQIIDEGTVAEILDAATAERIVREAFIALALGRANNPVRAVAAKPGGWLAAMPAYVDTGELRALGAKVVAVLPENAERGLPTHRATVVLCDPNDGTIVSLVAGETITLVRTAAASVVATRALAARPNGEYAVLGAGAQGLAHVQAFLEAGLLRSLRIWSRNRESALRLAAIASESVSVTVADTPREAVSGADVVITTTAATTPLFEAGDLAPHVHVNAVGACIPTHRELPGALVAAAAFYVDSRDGALREAGDLLLAMNEHGLDSSHIRGEIGTVLAGGEAVRNPTATIYESLGIGILDVACAAYVAQQVASQS